MLQQSLRLYIFFPHSGFLHLDQLPAPGSRHQIVHTIAGTVTFVNVDIAQQTEVIGQTKLTPIEHTTRLPNQMRFCPQRACKHHSVVFPWTVVRRLGIEFVTCHTPRIALITCLP